MQVTYHIKATSIFRCNSFKRYNSISLRNLSDKSHKGKVSNKAKAKIWNAINWLTLASPIKTTYEKKLRKAIRWKINFITLTFPIDITEDTAHKALHAFINSCRYSFNLKNFIWKKELTEAGRIHYHICTDTYMHYLRVRTKWNNILLRHGIEGGKNSTDIHSVPTDNYSAIQSYMCKYLTKDDKATEGIKKRLWGCNYELSEANKLKFECDVEEMFSVEQDLSNVKRDEIFTNDLYVGTRWQWSLEDFGKLGKWLKEFIYEKAFDIRHQIHASPV